MDMQIQLLTGIFTILYFIVLIFAIILVFNVYICDTHTCKAFDRAGRNDSPNTKEFVLELLTQIYNDGIWPFAFIGSSIATGLCIMLVGIPLTAKNFFLMFLLIFIVIYFLFSWFGHHYLTPIVDYVYDYIDKNTEHIAPAAVIDQEGPTFRSKSDDDDDDYSVTYAAPINQF